MKKNLFLGVLAAVGLLFVATSCSTDEPEALSGDEAKVTFALDLEGAAQSRTISDGTGATKLVYAVYKGKDLPELLKMPGSDDNSQFVKEKFKPAGDEVTLTLVKGQTYTVVFWAQNPNCTAYTTTDFKKVFVDYEGTNNDETRDAFFKAESFTVEDDATISVTLKRPFAQINVGVTAEDWEDAVATGVKIARSKVTIKDVPTGINLVKGNLVGDATDVTYSFEAIPDEALKVDSNGDGTPEEFHYLSMSYILASANQSQLNGMEFTLDPEDGKDIVLSEGLNNVPVQRNWRTNIIGRILTNYITFNIVVDPAYTSDYNYNYPDGYEQVTDGVMLDAASKTYFLTSKKGLLWFQAQAMDGNLFENYTVKLTTDIYLTGTTWTPIPNFKGTFDGCNFAVKNLTVKTTNGASAGFFASAVGGTIRNLNLENVNITGDWKAGAISGDGLCARIENCHVKGGTITSTPRLTDAGYDNGNNVGGITGYLSAEPQAWVKDCSVSNLTIRAYSDVGGIVGTANGYNAAVPVISGNTVSNVTITANQLCEYGEEGRATNADEFVGRNLANADWSTNTTENVAVNELVVDENGKIEINENTPLPNIANITNDKVKEVVLTGNVEGKAEAKYGNSKVGVILPAGITLDGGEHSLASTTMGTSYVIMTQGGTIENFSAIEGGQRGIVTCAPTGNVIIDNVVIDQPGYAINTAEPAKEEGLIFKVKNSTINGWSSWAGGFDSAEFTNCKFGENSTKYWQNRRYPQMYDRLMKPYITTTFTKCTMVNGFYIDLEELKEEERHKLTFEQCKVDGTVLTADNYADLVVFIISDKQKETGDLATWVGKLVEFK